jgi:hypothetical protein
MVRRGRLECGGIEPRSDQTKDYTIGICCFSAKHAALRSKSKDWLARNQNNVSGWSDMSPGELLFQWASAYRIPTQRTSSSSHWKLTWYSWKIAELALNNNHSLTHSLTPVDILGRYNIIRNLYQLPERLLDIYHNCFKGNHQTRSQNLPGY